MTETTQTQLDALAELRLPDLQARFAEIVGEETRCPNKTYLLRRIREALEAAAVQPAEPELQPEPQHEPQEPDAVNAVEAADDVPSRELDVEGLRARYLAVVGRSTSSHDRPYLIWKIRQAQRGRVPVGPVGRSQRSGQRVEHKVLPLRMPVETVNALDEARKRQGLKSRMELFRRALHLYLTSVGEAEAAEPFAPRG